MSVNILEYLGKRTTDSIVPWVLGDPIVECPFFDGPCAKISRRTPQKPICSVESDGRLWITCEHRLLTSKNVPISHPYLSNRITEIAEILWGHPLNMSNVAVSREHNIAGFNADYVFALNPQWKVHNVPLRYSMEVQGGGDTTQTGNLTRHVDAWESDRDGHQLDGNVSGVQPNVLNVWKRMLSQLITKGLAATRMRQGVGCIIGDKLFDEIQNRTGWTSLAAPEDGYVDFVVISYSAAESNESPVNLVPDHTRMIRSTFQMFLDQMRRGGVDADFSGRYEALDGRSVDAE